MKPTLADPGRACVSLPHRGCRFLTNPPIVSTFILNESDRRTGGGAMVREKKKD
jgi:hypothetical protein